MILKPVFGIFRKGEYYVYVYLLNFSMQFFLDILNWDIIYDLSTFSIKSLKKVPFYFSVFSNCFENGRS